MVVNRALNNGVGRSLARCSNILRLLSYVRMIPIMVGPLSNVVSGR